ncbi:TonB-dependent receptor [Gaoshiqia sp. Z1-71]|uniref:TonB-dependent receptor n=1 Tax=Gaoshiqia hydrogeniformans TaxID=3290090 RepID=UPI003BF7D4A6
MKKKRNYRWRKIMRMSGNFFLAMKLTFLLVLLGVVQLSASVYSQGTKLSFELKNRTVKEVLRTIEDQSEFRFFYNEQFVDLSRKVSVSSESRNIESILSEVFSGSNISFKVMENKLIIITPADGGQNQQKPVSGKITDSSGVPLPGVTIVVKGTTQGTITGADGSYSLPNVPGNATLIFSFVGMKTQEVVVSGRSTISISMDEDAIGIEEVVAIGYGTMKKSDLTGSVASVKGETLAEIPGATVAQALQGRTAGVHIQQQTGAPGSAIQIRIRGNNSIMGSNEPLWVVDGFPVSSANMVNLSDIETIDVLKDASATAIFGSRGANGVVIVTTKRGKAGKSKITYEGSYGIQRLRKKFDMCNAEEYMKLMNIQQFNDFGTEYFSQEQINNAGEGTDWQDLVYRDAPVQNHALNFTGGNDKTKFALGASYFDQEGIVINSGYNKISLRNSIDHQFSKALSVAFNAILSRTTREDKDDVGGLRGNNVLHAAFAAPPTVGPYYEDGTYRELNMDYPFSATGFINPIAYLNEKNRNWYSNRVMSNLAFIINPISDLTIRIAGNVENTDYRWDRYDTRKYPNSSGAAGIEMTNTLELTSNNTISYDKTIDKHSFSVMAGSTYEQYVRKPLSVTGTGYIHDILESYDIGSAEVMGLPSSGYTEWRLLSFLGRANYSYDGKYLATVTFRKDGSSRYSEGHKWGNFPSAALAWKISKEEFMQDLDFISNLKLRAGYGVTGSTAISAYSTINLLESVSAVLNKQYYTGFEPKASYPGDLKWETTAQTNIGFDLGLFNNRIQLVADYYIKNTTDLLNNVQLPTSSGYTTTIKNIGKMRNKGFEFQVDAFIIDHGNFKWNVSSNISFNRNEVVELSGGKDISGTWYSLTWMGDYVNLIREGQPFGIFYGYKEAGYNDSGKILYWNNAGEKVLKSGLTEEDRTYIGNPNPDFTYSINSTMSYKNFSLSFYLQGVQGNEIMCLSTGSANYDYGWGLNNFKEVLYDHWTPQNTDAKYPVISSTNTYAISDRFVYDGSYIRLKNIELAYSIPTSKLGISWISRGQVYISGQNLLTITSYPWADPDVNSRGGASSVNQGIDHFSYPTAKSLTVGVRFDF